MAEQSDEAFDKTQVVGRSRQAVGLRKVGKGRVVLLQRTDNYPNSEVAAHANLCHHLP